MKKGDRGFIYNERRNGTLYVEVERITSKGMVLNVINGGYDLFIDFVKIPDKIGDYNSAINWYEEQLKKPKKIKVKPICGDDEIPF
jgi:hypothetical protein